MHHRLNPLEDPMSLTLFAHEDLAIAVVHTVEASLPIGEPTQTWESLACEVRRLFKIAIASAGERSMSRAAVVISAQHDAGVSWEQIQRDVRTHVVQPIVRVHGKLVVFGHTATAYLPVELSTYTPEDPLDIWAGPCCVGLDTGAGKGGFLTAIELPSMNVYESR